MWLVDAGPMITNSLGLLRAPLGQVGGVLFTHYHSGGFQQTRDRQPRFVPSYLLSLSRVSRPHRRPRRTQPPTLGRATKG